jgi:hypothetical protein
MVKKAAFITIHGMGDTEPSYSANVISDLTSRLGAKAADLHIGSVYYQGILQPNEKLVWDKVAKRLKWDALRKFLLYGFADAAGLENGKESLTSVYSQAQIILARELIAARKAMNGDGPVVILAQSLGCQVASCYFWDALSYGSDRRPNVGIWQDLKAIEEGVNGSNALTPEEIAFLQGKSSLRALYTTGCNIPIFVAAHLTKDILPIEPNTTFEWHNFYDKDDVLGWPLAELSDGYRKIVKDHVVNAGGGIMGWILKSWNPMSHGQYWGDDEVLDPLESELRKLLG